MGANFQRKFDYIHCNEYRANSNEFSFEFAKTDKIGLSKRFSAFRHSIVIIDAPVLNLLSTPCGVGNLDNSMYCEFVEATGYTVIDMINYRNHPIDRVEEIIKSNIPVFMVCGDCDTVVPYLENGKFLSDKFKKYGGNLTEVLKAGCNHHPHGLEDNKPLIDFTLKYY